MKTQNCSHLWEMTNIFHGLIVMKRCFKCSKVSSCFLRDDIPPLEPCHEGEHFWNFMECDKSFHFDLRCSQCGTLIRFDELVGLMLCVGCDESCEVDVLRRKLEKEGTRVYIAFCRRPIDERPQLDEERFAILEDYFEQQNKSLKSKIKIVSHEMIRSIDSCYAQAADGIEELFHNKQHATLKSKLQ